MKKKGLKIFICFLLLTLCLITSCDTTTDPTDPVIKTDPVVVLKAKESSISINEDDVESYDYSSLFTLIVDSKMKDVLLSYVDRSNVDSTKDSFVITCSYGDKSIDVTVNVIKNKYLVTSSIDEVTLSLSSLKKYDFNSLFTVTKNGEKVTIESSMVTSTIKEEIGNYTYTVSYMGVSKSIDVCISSSHDIEVVKSYKTLSIPYNEIDNYDYTNLFTIYVDGINTEVKSDMIDKSALTNVEVGNDYLIKLNTTIDSMIILDEFLITVCNPIEYVVGTKEITTFPNAEYIDVTTLFSVSYNGNVIEVTPSMVEGVIDYSKEGSNIITLTIGGNTYESVVNVVYGVVINYANSSEVLVVKGTNKDTYDFTNDFRVYVNGIRYTTSLTSYINTDEVDFNTCGSYTATIRIPYNEKKLGISSVSFTYYEKTITYKVVSNTYTASVVEELVTLDKGTKSYDVTKNLSVIINGKTQSLTNNKLWVDSISCYYEVKSNEIDFSSKSTQHVCVDVYVYGVNEDPISLEYDLIIKSNIVITPVDTFIFEKDNIVLTDLFTITDDGENVLVTSDMIEGKVNNYKQGTYTVTLTYDGISCSNTVIVFDDNLVGTYVSSYKTIAVDDGDEEYGIEATPQSAFSDLVITRNGEITLNGKTGKLSIGNSSDTLTMTYGSYDYTVYYNDGILILDPDNSVKLGFNDYKRPMVYFSSALYELERKITINSSSSYVLDDDITCYSIDCFKVKKISDGSLFYFGMKIHLTDKTSADTVYNVTWGYLEFNDGFNGNTSENGTLKFNGDTYTFTMSNRASGKVYETEEEKIYAGLTFKGTIDGKDAKLVFNQYEGMNIVIDSKTYASLSSYDFGNLKYGGIDHEDGIIYIYAYKETYYSFKFQLNTVNKTFTVLEKDGYQGLYKLGNYALLLDGYGKGVVTFDLSGSYMNYPLTYSVNSDFIIVNFENTNYLFEYGDSITFVVDPLLNKLTVRKSIVESLVDTEWINSYIETGALVEVDSNIIGADSDAVAKTKFIESISITTKDGELSSDDKKKLIDTSLVKFSTPGFYQYTISIELNGEVIKNKYSLQIVEAIYDESPIVGEYGEGIVYKATFSIDKYGMMKITYNGDSYTGFVTIDNNIFYGTVYNELNQYALIEGNLVSDGIVYVKSSGIINFVDYFTTGTFYEFGCDSLIIRAINVSDNYTYFASLNSTQSASKIDVNLIEGTKVLDLNSIIGFEFNNKDYVVKIYNTYSLTSGIEIGDKYRGTYTSSIDISKSIIIDGFGSVSGEYSGSYTVDGKVLYINSNGVFTYLTLDYNNMSYTIKEVTLDSNKINGNTYSATYSFTCGSYSYSATTSFQFSDDGVCTVTSTSESHDDSDSGCENDTYDCKFAGVGTYSISGSLLIVNVNGYSFSFYFSNLAEYNSMCLSTESYPSTSHGYIPLAEAFTF